MHKDLPSLSEQLLGPEYAEVPFDQALEILREKLDREEELRTMRIEADGRS
jgi:hypothetical protein